MNNNCVYQVVVKQFSNDNGKVYLNPLSPFTLITTANLQTAKDMFDATFNSIIQVDDDISSIFDCGNIVAQIVQKSFNNNNQHIISLFKLSLD